MTRRDDSLIGQIVAANVVLFALTLLAASVAAGLDLGSSNERWEFLIIALAIVLTLCVNLWMLQRRFRPLERLIDEIESIDPAEPSPLELRRRNPVEEIDRLALVPRPAPAHRGGAPPLGPARDARPGGGAPPPRPRPPRRGQPGAHRDPAAPGGARPRDARRARAPEVAELKRLVNQAMDELLNLARQLRPSALDDHGLVPAVETQLKRFSARTGIEVRLDTRGAPTRCRRSCRPPSTWPRRRSRT